MKRLLIAVVTVLAALLLCSCHAMGQREYYSITPHEEPDASVDDTEAVLVENYPELKNAILSFVENGTEYGVIRIYNYAAGSVEEDVARATYDVAKNNPLGAYAVDYMTHECNLIVSYYEIHISSKFRRTVEDIRAIRQVSSKQDLYDALTAALVRCDERLAVRTPYYIAYDLEEMVQEYYELHPELVVEIPELSVGLYPEDGDAKIVEINLKYNNTLEQLQSKKADIAANVLAAAQYVSYRTSDWEKLQLLYSYLQGRFTYTAGKTVNPVYSALCEGIADDEGMARAMELICRQLAIEASVTAVEVDGRLDYGNRVVLDGTEYTIDAARDILAGIQLELVSLQPAEQSPEEPTRPEENPDAAGTEDPAQDQPTEDPAQPQTEDSEQAEQPEKGPDGESGKVEPEA